VLPRSEKERGRHDLEKPLDGVLILLDRIRGHDLTALGILGLEGTEKSRYTADPSN
jgi:hypothetical protein